MARRQVELAALADELRERRFLVLSRLAEEGRSHPEPAASGADVAGAERTADTE